MVYIKKTKGKYGLAIKKEEAFYDLLGGYLPSVYYRFDDLFTSFDEAIREFHPKVKDGALSNTHGDWYEWLLSFGLWRAVMRDKDMNFAFILPNKTRFDVTTLYEPDVAKYIHDLREKVKNSAGGRVSLITSNPDFAIVKRHVMERVIGDLSFPEGAAPEFIKVYSSLYKEFKGQCGFEDIVGYMSVKSSFRPDRRLQIPHEGSLMKALYVHLQTRQWIIDPPGLKYYAITGKKNDSDVEALSTVATHSIISVHDTPQRAVDKLFQVDSLAKAHKVFREILAPVR